MPKKIIPVPYIDQTVKYPTGCESISTVMLLQYLGFDITPETFIDNYLPKKDFEFHDGILYGPDPHRYFIGSPYNNEKGSYGCYAGAIIDALRLMPLVGDRFSILDETGTPMSVLIREYLNCELPVIFWATLNMREAVEGPVWRLIGSGELFCWKSNLHCLLLVGYDEDNFYFNDPWENHGCIGYSRALTEQRHIEQYAFAVGLKPRA